ncbi:MAG: hypothetical protein NTW99_02065 [Chloroflexi bacterium]|nr:hypothetical protein [Chloroflexota bacterium]
MSFAISPQQQEQVDVHHNCMVFARPMAGDHCHLFGIRLVQSRIIDHQNPLGSDYQIFNFLPKSLTVWWEALQQTGVGVMRRGTLFIRHNF